MTKATAALKVRLAYTMNEQGYPMTREQIALRPTLVKDARRVRLTGSYRKSASYVETTAY